MEVMLIAELKMGVFAHPPKRGSIPQKAFQVLDTFKLRTARMDKIFKRLVC